MSFEETSISYQERERNHRALDRMWKMSGLIPCCFCQVFNYQAPWTMASVEFKEMSQIIPNILFMFRFLLNVWTNEWLKKTADHVIIIIYRASQLIITLPSSWAVATVTTVTISLYKYFLIALLAPCDTEKMVIRSTEGDIIARLCVLPVRIVTDHEEMWVMKWLFATHCVRIVNKWPGEQELIVSA